MLLWLGTNESRASGRKLSEHQQVSDFFEAAQLGELRNGIAAVAEAAFYGRGRSFTCNDTFQSGGIRFAASHASLQFELAGD